MGRSLFTIGLAAALQSVMLLTACDYDEGFSTDSSQVLSFPGSVISLDSVMAGMKSPSVTFMAYNNNDRAIQFDAFLVGGSQSVFEMIADGIDGNAARGLEIGAHDSSTFLLPANPEFRADAPSTLYSDTIEFILGNGAVQYLPVTVTSVNARKLDSYRVHGTESLEPGCSYLIFDSLYVPEGAILEIGPGTRLYFHNGAGMAVDGRIVANGLPDSRIRFSGYRLDCITPGVPYDLTAGQWKGIRLGPDSYGNRFEWCDIHGAQYGIIADSSRIDTTTADIVSTIVHNMTGNCIELRGCKVNISNSQITNSGECCLCITGGETHVSFTTIADFSVWNMARVAVSIRDRISETDMRPYACASFNSCIITGRHKNEIEVGGSLESDYEGRIGISHSLIMTKDSLSGFYNDCLFENQKEGQVYGAANFVEAPGMYERCFRLDSVSRARGIGGGQAAFPTDLDGNARPTAHPDAGCYQYLDKTASQ